jgi:hypothetical protein
MRRSTLSGELQLALPDGFNLAADGRYVTLRFPCGHHHLLKQYECMDLASALVRYAHHPSFLEYTKKESSSG